MHRTLGALLWLPPTPLMACCQGDRVRGVYSKYVVYVSPLVFVLVFLRTFFYFRLYTIRLVFFPASLVLVVDTDYPSSTWTELKLATVPAVFSSHRHGCGTTLKGVIL